MRIPDWVGDFFENRGWLGLVQYSSTNGLNVSGTPVSYESVTYAQFIDAGFNLDDARHVFVSDRHSTRDASDECGSLWWIAPANATGYKRVLRSPPIYCATSAALPSASTFKNGRAYQADLGPEGCDMRSDATGWIPVQNSVIARDTVKSTALVCPASTFTSVSVASAAAGADTQLSSAGTHGLTTAVCVTAGASYIYISGGTGWTVGFHKINTVTESGGALVFTIDTPYDAGFGTPTIVLANSGTDVVLETITLPRLRANTKVTLDVSPIIPNTANNKNFKVKLGATTLVNAAYSQTTVTIANRAQHVFYNRASVSSQIGGTGSANPSGIGSSGAAHPTAAIDTSTGTAQLTLSYSPAAANEVCAIEAYEVVVS